MPISMFSDTNSTIQLANNPVFSEITKYIKIDCHFIRDKIKCNQIQVVHINTNNQVFDLIPKGLSHAHHMHLIDKLGVLNIYTLHLEMESSNIYMYIYIGCLVSWSGKWDAVSFLSY